MALPGSLDYLYYNGILDHIPYEAYSMPMMQASNAYQVNATEYLKAASQGLLYNTYTAPDVYIPRNPVSTNKEDGYSIMKNSYGDGGAGRDNDFEVVTNGKEGKKIRESFTETVNHAKDALMDSPTWIKGLLAGGMILLTAGCLLKGGKKPLKRIYK